jgi:AraC-like DNA-binding protein
LFFAMLTVAPQCGYAERLLNIDEIDRLYVKDANQALSQIQRLGSYCEKTHWKTCRRSKYDIVYCRIYMHKQVAPENLHYAFAALESSILEKDTSNLLVSLQFISEIYMDQGDYFKSGQYIQRMLNVAKNNPQWIFYKAQSKVYQSNVALKSQRPIDIVFKYLNDADKCYSHNGKSHQERSLFRWRTLLERATALLERKRYRASYQYLKKAELYLQKLKYKSKMEKVDVYMDDADFNIRLMQVHALFCLPLYKIGKKSLAENYFQKAINTQNNYLYNFVTELALTNYLEESHQWKRLIWYLDKYVDYSGKNRNTLLLMRKRLSAYTFLNDHGGEKRMIDLINKLSDTITLRNDLYAEEEIQAVEKIEKMESTIYSQQEKINHRKTIIIFYILLSFVLILGIVVAVFIIISQRRNNRILFNQIKRGNESASQLDHIISTSIESIPVSEKKQLFVEKNNVYCKKDYQDFVNNVKGFVSNDHKYAETNLTPDNIAIHFDVSRQFLDRVMKEFVGMTMYDFVTEMRLLHSCNLLENTNDIIYAIAINSGFGSERSFLRIFKQKYNMSPTMYRKISKGRKAQLDKN